MYILENYWNFLTKGLSKEEVADLEEARKEFEHYDKIYTLMEYAYNLTSTVTTLETRIGTNNPSLPQTVYRHVRRKYSIIFIVWTQYCREHLTRNGANNERLLFNVRPVWRLSPLATEDRGGGGTPDPYPNEHNWWVLSWCPRWIFWHLQEICKKIDLFNSCV